MPIYEYQCTIEGCGRLYDQLEPMNSPTTQACVDCGGLAKRLMSAPARGKMGSNNTKSENSVGIESEKSSDYPLCSHKGELMIGIAISIPTPIANSIAKQIKMNKAAPYN